MSSGICCVTGASGFVGLALCQALLSEGIRVNAIIRRPCRELEKLGAKIHLLDLSAGVTALAEVFKGADTVFHVAAKVDMWGCYADFFETNVVGTRNVISACKIAGVANLIYTSSPSVVADGNDLRNINESYPIPKRHHAPYPATKAIAECEVLASNGADLKTVALRPHLIFGPGDNHFIPTILDRARQGRLVIVGSGGNIVDVCFIKDCIQAHLCARAGLLKDTKSEAAGRAFFISQGDPIGLWEFIGLVLEANGLPPLKRKIPLALAKILAGIFELISLISPVQIKPLFTRFLVTEMATDHYFDISAARRFLGFKPTLSVREAIALSFPSKIG